MLSLKDYKNHPLIFIDDVLGFQGYSSEDIFCTYANGDNNFLLYGIAENSLLVVDQTLPFAEDMLNVFQTDTVIHGQKQLKISLARLKSFPHMGRVIMSVNRY